MVGTQSGILRNVLVILWFTIFAVRCNSTAAAAPSSSIPAPVVGLYNVRTYGAQGNGKHLDSPAINRAIIAAAKNGGGTVEIPPGIYLCGSIRLKSNINLHLDSGFMAAMMCVTFG